MVSFHPFQRRTLLAVLVFAVSHLVPAEVSRVEITHRANVGASGYEKIVGKIHFTVDPKDPRNALIADIDRAPLNTAGRVEFSSDLYILKPKDPKIGNGAALFEVAHRGNRAVLGSLNRGGVRDPKTEADLGDGFLMKQGFTVVWVGWECDVTPGPGKTLITVPVATDAGKPISGRVPAKFTPASLGDEFAVTDLSAYPPAQPDAVVGELAIRTLSGGRTVLPRERWRLRGTILTLDGGFTPGLEYEIAYEAANPPIAGLGFAALRDAAAWLKHDASSLAPVHYTYAFGSSQSGRFLRDFLYHGFNTDERDRPVYDGIIAHVAGAARIDLNRRWSVPREVGTYNITSFPFSDAAQTDPVSGARDGLLENPRTRHAPKIFYTNSSVEYWGGGRVAALQHMDPAGARDIPLPENVRIYAFAGTQHGPAEFPPPAPTVGKQRANPADYWWMVRALLLAMHRWVATGTPPPPSAYPTLRDGTLVRANAVAFPAIPGVASPRALSAGVRVANSLIPGGAGAGAPLPLLVPQVDADGNELAGVRLPEVVVPLATYTGWNFRSPAAGAPDTLVALGGAWIPFPTTRAAKEAANDPRRSIEERYASRADYIAKYRAAVDALVSRKLLLLEDAAAIAQRGGEQWDFIVGRSESGPLVK